MLVRALRAVVDDLFDDHAALTDGDGWAMRSVLRAIRRVALLVAAGWQVVMLLASFASLGVSAWPLALAQLALGGLALLGLRRRIPTPVIPLGMLGIGLWSYLASGDLGSTLVFAACWEIDFAACLIGLLVLRRISMALVMGPAVVISATLLVALPEWGVQLPVAIIVTQASIILAIRAGLPWLLRIAADADVAAGSAEAAGLRGETARRVGARLAEESRTLHDTAINTLGAIANGGAGVADPVRVRAQCARDVELLRVLRGEQQAAAHDGLRAVFAHVGLPVTRSGLGDEELARMDRVLGEERSLAVAACVREATTNAVKHSGADSIGIALTATDDELRVVVRDAGRGFVGSAPQGRGIDSSILARARAAGFTAEITSREGTGTSVELRVPLGAGGAAQTGTAGATGSAGGPGGLADWDGGGVRASVASLHARAGNLWALGVTAVSIALTLGGGTNRFFALYPMLGIMVLAWAVSRVPRLRRSRWLLSGTLIVCACAVFFLSAAATAFGAEGAVNWQALAPTGAFVLLLSLGGRIAPLIGAAAWILLAATIAVLVSPASPTAGQITIVAAAVGLGFTIVWTIFRAWVTRLAEEADRSRQLAFEANLRTELEAAAQDSYRRWVDAGLESAVELLRAVAEGDRDSAEPGIRRACGAEERYLRQLVQLSPELVHLSRALVPALRTAREREVDFSLRLGGFDTGDEADALDIADTVLEGIAALPQGAALTVSIFPVGEALQLTMLGPSLVPAGSPGASGVLERAGARYERLGSLDLVELTYARDTVAAGTTEDS